MPREYTQCILAVNTLDVYMLAGPGAPKRPTPAPPGRSQGLASELPDFARWTDRGYRHDGDAEGAVARCAALDRAERAGYRGVQCPGPSHACGDPRCGQRVGLHGPAAPACGGATGTRAAG